MAGVAVYGCSDASKFPASQTADVSDFYAASVQISYGTIPSGLSNNTWTELECDSSVLCRYVYFWDRVDWQWFGNAAEIQIFGWTAEDIAAENLPTDITGITVSAKPNGTVSVDWVCPGRPESFTVERREMPDGAWAPLASVGGAVKTYDDTTAAYDATYSYRVTAVYESESRVSDVCQTTYLDPAEFSVAPSGDGNAYAVLTWDATGTFADGAKIYRKAGAGAWQVLDEALAGDDSYTDETVLYGGGEYLYRLGPSGSDEMASATVSYYRLKKFAGTALDLNFNHPGQSATLLLDGNLYTYGDIYQNGMGNPALGIDAGEKVFVKKALVYPRQESGYLYRIVGVSVYGNNDTAGLPASSADSAGAFFANETRISGGLPNVLETGRWYELECSTAAA
ncbi:MAG: hypothetical protein ILO34_07690, partial [Kiritimatiellae bacterium]|nr:hypothetical protein [Kiritimatiellia bacterium]